jgi:hypothetical protein
MPSVGTSRNRGELSELYVLARTLSDRTIQTDSGQRKSDELTIYKVFRNFGDSELEFLILGADVRIVSQTPSLISGSAPSVSRQRIGQLADELLKQLQSNKKLPTLKSIPSAMELMELLEISKVSSSNRTKSDIGIVVHDPVHSTTVTRYFSIKSRIGSAPSLVNSSKATRFRYQLDPRVSTELIRELNELKPAKLVRAICDQGVQLQYVGTDDRFSDNLNLLDGHLERLVAECLLSSYVGRGRDVADVVERVAKENPLGLSNVNSTTAYKLKFLQFLQNVSLGMTAIEPWDGALSVTGGFIEVLRDGSLHFYHPEDQKLLREHLWISTKFDTPSTSRHDFGFIFVEQNKQYLELNLQIRYK